MRLLFLFLALSWATEAYRLNVPRVLLPYHPTISVKFILEVSQPSGGCFHWRSTRSDVVTVTGVGVRAGECSDRAEIKVSAKSFAGELTAVVFAEDKLSHTTLSCGVSVDQIAHIRIETTTKVLFVDAAPARMVVEAINSEGDKFSTLSEIPLDWELAYSGSDRPLRIVQFEQSTYDAPTEILALEKQKKKGYVILVEGTGTGSATLTAKFNDQFLSHIPPFNLDLAVIANLLLIPSQDLYVFPHTVVPFQVIIVRQHSQEIVPMPSDNYYLQLENESICSLDKRASSVYALAKGRTNVILQAQNVDLKAKTGIRPPSTVINVVDPDTLQWSVSGNSWIVQRGRSYELQVNLIDPHGNGMYIGDNLRFDSFLDSKVLDVHHSSENQSYFVVTPKVAGKTVVRSRFTSVLTKEGRMDPIGGKIAGEQNVEVVDPLQVIPGVVIIPYTNKARMDSQLKAIGGTGSYMWSVEDNSVCKVEKSSGLLSCTSVGSTRVTVTDRRNEDLFANAEVLIVDPLSVSFGETVKEAEVGTDLILNVDLRGSGPKGPISFTDCRNIRWQVQSDDASILEPIPAAESTLPTVGTGCGTVRLRAISAGDTTVRISHDNLQAEVQVSTHLPLKASVESLALAVGSSHVVRLEGGPRPWLLDSSGFFRRGAESNAVSVSFLDDGMAELKCAGQDATETFELLVGNSKSSSLPIPLVSSTSISICCASPTRLVLSFEQNKCHAVPPVVLSTSSVPVVLSGYGTCGKERLLESISSLKVDWSLNDASLGRLETSSKTAPVGRVLSCRGKSGLVTVTADVSAITGVGKIAKLSATSDIRLVQPVAAFPSSLVLWNEKGTSGTVELRGGSGQFMLRRADSGPFAVSIKDRKVTVAPRMQGSGILRVTDNCLPDADIDISVKITKVDALAISAPAYVEVGSTVEVLVEAVDETGTAYPYDLSETKLEITNRAMQILKRQGQRYVLTASEVGAVSLSATAKSSSGPLSSRPHSIQVYSPISFEPKLVTLIPESTFQLEVIGGPLPTPPIVFSLNNSKIADVQSNALISSKDLGYTSVTGAVSFAADHSSTDTVVVRVVSLAGITLSASTTVLERGGRFWITVRGLDETEVPFAFGGATYPFKVKWSIESPEVLNPVHPFGESFIEPANNRFSIWLDAATVGTTRVTATVELSDQAKHHFVGRNRVFSASVVVNVKEIPGLLQPQMPLSTVRMGPNSALPLHLNLPESTVEYVQRLNSIVAVSPTGTVRSTSREGSDFVAVITNTPAGNETILIPVVVSSPVALDVVSATTGLYAREDQHYNLPVGAVLTLNVFARDFLGRRLHSVKSDIHLRPHRFDLTEISSNSDGSEISVTLRAAGETVLKIWDASSASTSPVFVRILAGEAIIPAGAKYFVSDVICLHSPLSGQSHWFSADSGIQFLDASLGVARFVKPGLVHFSVQTDSQTLHAKAAVEKTRALSFVEGAVPYVSNNKGATFTFPFAPSNTTPNRYCNAEQRKLVADLRPPVECSLLFDANTVPPALNLLSVKAVYSLDSDSYACVVSRQSAGSVFVNVVGFPKTNLLVKAKWDGQTDGESVTRTVFHAAMEVQGSEVRVSDAQQSPTVLSVAVPSYQLQHVSAFGCDGDLLTIKELSQAANQQANKFFAISLNVKSAALWSEMANKCSVTVRNSVTGQTIVLPVRVKIVGQEMKQVYNALESNGFIDFSVIVLQRYKWIIPSLMWTCLLGIAILLGYAYLKNYVWEKSGVFTDESVLRSPASSRLNGSANSSLRDSFHSSPGNSPRAGSTDQLWSTSELRCRY